MRLGAKAKYAQVKQYETERQAKLELLGEAAIAWFEESGGDESFMVELEHAAGDYARAAKRSR
jgi:hypothetical protein